MLTTDQFFHRTWCMWLWATIIGVMCFGVAPYWVAVLALAASVWTFMQCVKLAYYSESFTAFATLRILFSLAVCPSLAFILAAMLAAKLAHLDRTPATILGLACVMPVLLMYVWAYKAKFKKSVFIFDGERVGTVEPRQSSPIVIAGFSAGAASLLYPLIAKYGNGMTVLLGVIVGLSVYLAYYQRHQISSLKELKRIERATQCSYTFMDIEDIRLLRKHSLIARFLYCFRKPRNYSEY